MKHALDSQLRLLERPSEGSHKSKPSAARQNEHAERLEREHVSAIRVGRIASIDAEGKVLVTLGEGSPVPARLSTTVRRAEVLEAAASDMPVLLLLEDGVVAPPILVGMVRDRLEDSEALSQGAFELLVGRDRIVLTAHQELTLRCGEGNITLRRDGKIIIKGEEIVSRARRTNKVKGATVRIN